jgi:hypothetical protein
MKIGYCRVSTEEQNADLQTKGRGVKRFLSTRQAGRGLQPRSIRLLLSLCHARNPAEDSDIIAHNPIKLEVPCHPDA